MFSSSHLTLSRVVRLACQAQIVCMYLGPKGLVGFHQATVQQIFLVVDGSGWVRGEAPERVPIAAGRAAFWEAGEWHESGSETGMTAIVIESESLDPVQFMPEAPDIQ
jgi:quercetin dioxygenase-like cupin family protein